MSKKQKKGNLKKFGSGRQRGIEGSDGKTYHKKKEEKRKTRRFQVSYNATQTKGNTKLNNTSIRKK